LREPSPAPPFRIPKTATKCQGRDLRGELCYIRAAFTAYRRQNEQRPSGTTGDTRTPGVCYSGDVGEIPGFPCGCRTSNPNVLRPRGQVFRSFLYDMRSAYDRRIRNPPLTSRSALGVPTREAVRLSRAASKRKTTFSPPTKAKTQADTLSLRRESFIVPRQFSLRKKTDEIIPFIL
jgi:hypothetical protein